ncbi:MAG: hypothetical protein ABIP94_03990 [Planctomycetota bacterium]
MAVSLTVASALAQTTGVVGTNDYTINGNGSGGTSCVPLCFPNGGVTLNLAVSAPLGAIAIAFFNFCPCLPCQLPGPSNACVPTIPATACGGSNQSFDMDLSPPCGLPFNFTLTVNTAGVYAASIPIPPLPGLPCSVVTLSTQVIIFNSCGLGTFAVPGPFILTQAFTINF